VATGCDDVVGRDVGKPHRPFEQGQMLHRQAGEENRDGDGCSDAGHARLSVETCQERPATGECDRQEQADACIDPEQVADQSMIDLLPLDHGLGKPIQPDVQQEQAKGGDHTHESEILGGEKPSQDDGGDHLDGEPQALGKHSDRGAPNGEASEPTALRSRPECTARVEGFHFTLEIFISVLRISFECQVQRASLSRCGIPWTVPTHPKCANDMRSIRGIIIACRRLA
jgi:hypothetical protein